MNRYEFDPGKHIEQVFDALAEGRASPAPQIPLAEAALGSWSPKEIVLAGAGVRSMTPEDFAALAGALSARGITAALIEKPQPGIEQIIDFSSPLCTSEEVSKFAIRRSYNEARARRFFNVLRQTASGENIKLDDFSDYQPQNLPVVKAEDLLRIVTSRSANLTPDQRSRIDRISLLHNVRRWIQKAPDIKGLGPRCISFWADYCNHAFPDLDEPLPVMYPPGVVREDSKATELNGLEPDEVLFDRITLEGQEITVVSNRSLLRYARSIGYIGRNVPQFTKFFNSICFMLAPDANLAGDKPLRLTETLIKIKSHSTESGRETDLGMTPLHFKELIATAESDDFFRKQLRSYTQDARRVIERYLQAIDEILTQES